MMERVLDSFISCDLKKLRVLLKHIGINGKVPGTEGFTPLHVIAGIDPVVETEDVVLYLFENGADPNSRSDENLTPVHIAAMWNRCTQLKMILEHGGNPWLTDDKNKNSFDMAADYRSHDAYQLLHVYLALGKLNFRPENKESKKLTFATPETYDTPKGYGSSIVDYLNNSLNLTFVSAKSPNFRSPSVFSTPLDWANSKFNDFNESHDCTFMSAKENFPLIFSSNDETDDMNDEIGNINGETLEIKFNDINDDGDTSDANEFLKHILNKTENYMEKLDKSDITEDEEEEGVNEINVMNVNSEKHSDDQKKKSNLNKAYIFSSSSESTGTTTSDLNESDDSICGTIIDTDYTGDKSDIVLIETKNDKIDLCSFNSSVCSVLNDWKTFHNITRSCSSLSYCSSHSKSSLIVPEDFQKYSNTRIFEELKKMGDNPGPVLDHTRHVYLHRLTRLMSGCAISCELPKPKYCPEIYLFLGDKLDMDRADYLEQLIEEEFDAEMSKDWREGNQRCCFNYFLLDPRVTQNLPQRAKQLTSEQIFMTFLDALFYVGKGTKGRPYSHLFEAAKLIDVEQIKSDKVQHILDIWDTGLGVISLHCFHNSIPVEAYTREACLIEAVGLDNLTNMRKGDYYGLCAKLTTSRKRLIGISLLHKALQIFLLEGERAIKPRDIKRK